MHILYLGSLKGTSKHRHDGLTRLGHKVLALDPFDFLPKQIVLQKWYFETGALGFELYIKQKILASIKGASFDLILVNQGELIGPGLIHALRKHSPKIINYNNDLPFGNRDKGKWRIYMKSIPHYDLLAVRSNTPINSVLQKGGKRIMPVFMSADNVIHQPLVPMSSPSTHNYDVLFIGTWFPERGPFISKLIQMGLPISIYGPRWQKAQEWPIIAPHWKGHGLYDKDYTLAIQNAKINLGLLSKVNGDLHTQRSIEIPAVKGLLCAERTTEHSQMYKDGEEAIFWEDENDCFHQCTTYLNNPIALNRIKEAGHLRCLKNGLFNERLLQCLIDSTFSTSPPKPFECQT